MARTIGLIVTLGFIATSSAQGSQDPMEICYRETDSAARLACFDREMQRRHASTPIVRKPAEDNTGLEGKELQQKLKAEGIAVEPVKPITARIAQLLPRPNKEYAFVLDNGQTWEQAEEKADLYANPHDSVTIKPGVLGSFYMTISGNQRIRVHRIR